MKYTILAFLALASVALLVPRGEAQPQTPEGKRANVIDRFDANGDGQLDRAEFQQLRKFMRTRRLNRVNPSAEVQSGRRFQRPSPPKLAGEDQQGGGPGQKLRRRPPRSGGGGPETGPNQAPHPGAKPGSKARPGGPRGRRQLERNRKRPDGSGRDGRSQRGGRKGRGPDQCSGCNCNKTEI